MQDQYFKILDDGSIDYLKPVSEAIMIVILQDLEMKLKTFLCLLIKVKVI